MVLNGKGSTVNDSNDISVDDLLAGLVADQLAGREPDLETLLEAHPDRADEIRSRYKDLERLSLLWREGPVAAAPQGFQTGAIVGEYEIQHEIGRGGMGIVYLAHQKDLGRQVALKVIPPTTLSAITRQRFLREAKALASLSHPNIVPVFTAGEQSGSLFIAMEYVDGVPLSTLIRAVRNRAAGQKASAAWAECLASGHAPDDEPDVDRTKETAALDSQYLHACLSIAGQIASALAQAHDGGVIHRDIKPANIIIAHDGRARLLDFGLAAVHTEPHVTISGEFFGTPHYVSPEQAAGKSALVGPASDQYSLGAMLFECLALRPPFEGDSISVVLSNVLNNEPRRARQVNPTLPKDIETILAKALSKRPAERYDSMDDLAEDLERFASGRPILAKPANVVQRLSKWSRRRPVVAVLLVLLITLSVAGASVWSYQERQRRQTEQAANLSRIQAKKDRDEREVQAASAEQWRYARLMAEADVQWRKGDVPETRRLLGQTPEKWRAWEWDLLKWKCNSSKRSLPRGTAATHLAWRPDGKAIAVSSNVGDVQIWDPVAAKMTKSIFPGIGYTGGVAWLDGGERLAMACADGKVRIWDAAGKELLAFDGAAKGAGMTGQKITGFAVSSDSQMVLTSGGDLNLKGWVRLAEATTGKLIKTFRGHGSIIDGLAFVPDGKGFASVGRDGMIALWSIDQDKPVKTMRGHGAGFRFVYDAEFTPSGKYLVTSGQGGLVLLWDAKTGELVRTFRSTGSDIRAVAISPDGTMLAGVAVDGAATLWNLATGRIITLFRGHGSLVLSVGFSPDGKLLATGGQKSTQIWDLKMRQEGLEFGRPAAEPTFICNGKKIVAITGEVRIWSGDGLAMLQQLREAGNLVSYAAGHPGDPNLLATVNTKGRLDLWDLDSCEAKWTALPESSGKRDRREMAFSPDGRFLAVGVQPAMAPGLPGPSSVYVYDASSGKLLKKLVFDGSSGIEAVAFSPDGACVLLSSSYLHISGKQIPGGVSMWRTSDFEHVRTIHGQDRGLYAFAFSPDSKRIALGNNNRTIRLLDVASGQTIKVLHGHKSQVDALAFSPDGRRLVSAGYEVLLWDLFTAQPVMTLCDDGEGYDKRFGSVAFSPDGKSIIAGRWNRQMRIWSLPKD
jgi:eukaryotic-like serine/threonine-protein kinase